MTELMPSKRNELVETHLTYARALAAEVVRQLPSHVLREDLDAAAELGLVEAAQVFDPGRGILFKTFAYYRIRGAIYDAIRKMTWFSKSQYDKYRIEMAASEYMAEYTETAHEVPAQNAAQEAVSITETITSCYLLSLDAEQADVADHSARSAEETLLDEEQKQLVRRAMQMLPEKNREVIEGYYYQNLNLEEVGQRLGLSKSWVCRVHAKSIEMLREAMSELSALPATSVSSAR